MCVCVSVDYGYSLNAPRVLILLQKRNFHTFFIRIDNQLWSSAAALTRVHPFWSAMHGKMLDAGAATQVSGSLLSTRNESRKKNMNKRNCDCDENKVTPCIFLSSLSVEFHKHRAVAYVNAEVKRVQLKTVNRHNRRWPEKKCQQYPAQKWKLLDPFDSGTADSECMHYSNLGVVCWPVLPSSERQVDLCQVSEIIQLLKIMLRIRFNCNSNPKSNNIKCKHGARCGDPTMASPCATLYTWPPFDHSVFCHFWFLHSCPKCTSFIYDGITIDEKMCRHTIGIRCCARMQPR